MTLTETAFAKINLALHVRARLPNGYHALETVFAFCEHGDTLTVERGNDITLTIDGPFADGLSTTDNLVTRAAQAMNRGARLHLHKALPVASGIGGGSADAAAAMRLIARLYDVPLPPLVVQRRLGADVPACVISQTMRGEGVGEALTATASVTGTPVMLINPGIALATGPVFGSWDGLDRGPLCDWSAGRNDLTQSAIALVPEIAVLLDWLGTRHDVTFARMSGSGATCFALFDRIAGRDAAVAEAAGVFPDYWAMASVLR